MSKQVIPEGRNQQTVGDDPRAQLLDRLPVTERRLDLAGVSTAVQEGGEGEPIVLLHGQGEFAGVWMRVIPDLVTTHRVVIPDLPGHGASAVADDSMHANRVLDWLGPLIAQTCPSPPTLVGHLLGGAIAARFAIDHGNRLSRLVFVDALGLSPFLPTPRFALEMVRFLIRPTEHSRDRLFRQCFVDLDGLRDELNEDLELLAAYALDRARTPGQKAALRRLMPPFAMRSIPSAELAQIAVPTTLIWGRHDRQVRLTVAEAASARYGWPLHIIEDAGDDPAFEQPGAFLEALRAALATRSRGAVRTRSNTSSPRAPHSS